MFASRLQPIHRISLTLILGVVLSSSVTEAGLLPGKVLTQSEFVQFSQMALRGQTRAQDFKSSMAQAEDLFRSFAELQAEIKKAKTAEEKKTAQKNFEDAIDKAREHLQKANANLYKGMDPEHELLARYMLSYVYLIQKRSLEAGVLGEYIANYKYTPQPTKTEEEAEEEKKRATSIRNLGLEGAIFAMKAYSQEYALAPANNRDFERNLLRKSCETIIAKYPDSARSNEARLTLARIYHYQKLYVKSAEEYVNIPEDAFQYEDAQLQAGQLYWNLFLNPDRIPDWEKLAEKDQKAQQKDLKAKSEASINKGIAAFIKRVDALQEDQKPKDPSENVVLGKISLAQIHIQNGKYEDAIKVLSDDPWSVTKAIEVPNEGKRPKGGKSIKRQAIASLVNRLLLRSYVGTGNTEAFQETMKTLEKIAGESDSAYITAIYRDVAEKVAKELELIEDEERKAEVKASFESLLEKFTEREQGQTYSGLLWVATTYSTFGKDEEVSEDAQPYFDKASETYQLILDKAKSDSKFLSPGRALGVKLLLVKTKREAKDFDAALNLLAEILSQKAAVLEAQIEAAEILAEQAEANDDGSLYQQAIVGTSIGTQQKAPLWGWGKLAKQLQGLIDQKRNQEFSTTIWGWGEIALGRPQDRKKDASSQTKSQALLDYEKRHIEIRLKLVQTRYQYAMTLAGNKKKTELGKAGLELRSFASITESLEPEDYKEFNAIYNKILTELGEPAEDLRVGGQTGT